MKKIIITQFLFLFLVGGLSFSSHAQDRIIKRSGEEIFAKVMEIEDLRVKYKLWDRMDGPVYSILRTEVFMILYANGSKDVFDESGQLKPQVSGNLPPATTPPAAKTTTSATRATEPQPSTKISTELNRSRFYLAYTPSTSCAFGLQMGSIGGSFGFFGEVRLSGFGGEFAGLQTGSVCDDEGNVDGSGNYYTYIGDEITTRGSFALGFSTQTSDYWHYYFTVGYGYKNYWHNYESNSTGTVIWTNHDEWDHEGLEYGIGFITDFGGFNLNAGVTTVNFSVYDLTFGLGISL